MAAEEPLLFDLVEAVLEGRPVDWTEAESTISESQPRLSHLVVGGAVRGVHTARADQSCE